jgi:hypothetical protein
MRHDICEFRSKTNKEVSMNKAIIGESNISVPIVNQDMGGMILFLSQKT